MLPGATETIVMARERKVPLAEHPITRLVLADDNRPFRDSIRALLDKEPGLKVEGQAQDGEAAIRLARELEPDVVIMDVIMPNLSGIEATREIISSLPYIKVIALSLHGELRFVEAMLDAGASGYLLKDHAFKELPMAIRTVVSGQTYFSPKIAGDA